MADARSLFTRTAHINEVVDGGSSLAHLPAGSVILYLYFMFRQPSAIAFVSSTRPNPRQSEGSIRSLTCSRAYRNFHIESPCSFPCRSSPRSSGFPLFHTPLLQTLHKISRFPPPLASSRLAPMSPLAPTGIQNAIWWRWVIGRTWLQSNRRIGIQMTRHALNRLRDASLLLIHC